jgi:hypothetical protein
MCSLAEPCLTAAPTHDCCNNHEECTACATESGAACFTCGNTCQCDLIAKVRADERAKYVLPDLPRGGEHVDWCRDLACYGCEEIAEGVIAQSL